MMLVGAWNGRPDGRMTERAHREQNIVKCFAHGWAVASLSANIPNSELSRAAELVWCKETQLLHHDFANIRRPERKA